MAKKITLTLPDELYLRLKHEPDLNASALLARCAEHELDRREALLKLESGMQDVECEDREGRTVIFTGSLLASNGMGTAYVYLTKRKRIAVVVFHDVGTQISDYDSLDDAAADGHDEYLLADAGAALGENRPIRLDI
jgi:hypothetical protein